jgi:hypothetical protein
MRKIFVSGFALFAVVGAVAIVSPANAQQAGGIPLSQNGYGDNHYGKDNCQYNCGGNYGGNKYGNVYGSSGYGNSGYGNKGYGSNGYGSNGYGSSGYGNKGYGSSGYGNKGYGSSNVVDGGANKNAALGFGSSASQKVFTSAQ